jgi:hypothetical protein
MTAATLLIAPLLALSAGPETPTTALWGAHGHEMIGRVAAENLPEAMPAFFRESADQLSWLNPEPDRWRSRTEREMDPAMDGFYSLNHYINFERIPASALAARDRYAYQDSLRAAGHEGPMPGFVHLRILEKTQRLRVAFREWRAETDPDQRRWIEARIVNDAGILGHYVADGSNPHHTTIHFNGWDRDTPNPRGFTTDRSFHRRFESEFVGARLGLDDVRGAMRSPASAIPDLRPAIIGYLRESNGLVERLYELEQVERFSRDTRSPEHHAFAAARLAAGAEMLRDLWWTAWVTSESE